jgi:hypothetical protein
MAAALMPTASTAVTHPCAFHERGCATRSTIAAIILMKALLPDVIQVCCMYSGVAKVDMRVHVRVLDA